MAPATAAWVLRGVTPCCHRVTASTVDAAESGIIAENALAVKLQMSVFDMARAFFEGYSVVAVEAVKGRANLRC